MNKLLNRLSIRVKLLTLAVVTTLVLVLMAGFMAWNEFQASYEGRKTAIKDSVESISAVLDWAYKQETSGALPRDKAQAAAMAAIGGARYSGNEYFWLQDLDAKVLMHPIKPELNGTDGSKIKDPDGNAVFVLFAKVARDSGSGYVSYLWPKPGQDKPVEKVSYVQQFKPWGWVVGSGLYTDDLRSAFIVGLEKTAVAVVLALFLTLYLNRLIYQSVTRGLDKAGRVARAVASGDISQEIYLVGSDEIGHLIGEMKTMSEQLNATMSRVSDAANGLATASAEISTANHDLSARTEQTASSLEQTAASMEQLTGSVRQNAEGARHAQTCVTTASSVADEGGKVVAQVVSTMHEIDNASRKISDIIGVIDGIAFQTNILALNAAVEAARAGEQGRGFAVVASEVRSLAGRSAEAAKEIKNLINASVAKTAQGAELVSAAGDSMTRIVAAVEEVRQLVGNITVATSEQTNGISQVNTAVSHLDQMTQQNAALVEESAAAAESLREQAEHLAQIVSQFKLADDRAQAAQKHLQLR